VFIKSHVDRPIESPLHGDHPIKIERIGRRDVVSVHLLHSDYDIRPTVFRGDLEWIVPRVVSYRAEVPPRHESTAAELPPSGGRRIINNK
jgi:hypothetical protein